MKSSWSAGVPECGADIQLFVWHEGRAEQTHPPYCFVYTNSKTKKEPGTFKTRLKSLLFVLYVVLCACVGVSESVPPDLVFFSQRHECVGPSPPPFHWAALMLGPVLCKNNNRIVSLHPRHLHTLSTVYWVITYNIRYLVPFNASSTGTDCLIYIN